MVVTSVRKEALDLTNARINHQGVILQGTRIAPNMLDYALKITNSHGQAQCEWIFASDVGGAVETVRGSGSHLGEWNQAFSMNLQGCADIESAP